jgi:hypothetical protein
LQGAAHTGTPWVPPTREAHNRQSGAQSRNMQGASWPSGLGPAAGRASGCLRVRPSQNVDHGQGNLDKASWATPALAPGPRRLAMGHEKDSNFAAKSYHSLRRRRRGTWGGGTRDRPPPVSIRTTGCVGCAASLCSGMVGVFHPTYFPRKATGQDRANSAKVFASAVESAAQGCLRALPSKH